MAFRTHDLMITLLPSDSDSCSEHTLGGPPCPAFSEIPPAPDTPYCPPCPAFSEIPPAPDTAHCPLGGPLSDTGESALTVLQFQLREILLREL